MPSVIPAARSAQDLAEARAAIDELFRLLVSSGSSDLHLRTGEPPLLRRSGELVREALPVIPAERLEAMLTSIMTGESIGSVTKRNCRHRDAPSMRAASYNSTGIACSPARKMIML